MSAKKTRPNARKIKSPDELEQKWNEYKSYCDNYTVERTEFSQRGERFITATIKKPITYTIIGFCRYLNISRVCFNDTYGNDPDYTSMITRVRDEVQDDARVKFESGVIDSKLANLWLGKYKDTYVMPTVATDNKQDEILAKITEVLNVAVGGKI